MKKLLLISIILIGLVSCTPDCTCYVTGLEYAKKDASRKTYRVDYVGKNGVQEYIYTDSAYRVGQIIIY